MTRQHLIFALQQYKAEDAQEDIHRKKLLDLLVKAPDCFYRTRQSGHITASSWIVSPDSSQVLLLHHAKLDRWLQPGGHADGDEFVANVAMREAYEETGLTSLRPAGQEIFDIDIHTIPARKTEPEHFHYDIRFLITANPEEPFSLNHESKDIAWVPLEEAAALCLQEPSIIRLINKTHRMRNCLTVA